MAKQPITLQQAAERLNCSDKFFRKLIATGEIPAFQIGRKGFRIDPDDVEKWIADHTVKPAVDSVSVALSDLRL